MSAASQMLEIPDFRARISPITVAQYQQLPELNEHGRRTELIRGIVIEKRSKSPLHSGIATALYDLVAARDETPFRHAAIRETPFRSAAGSHPPTAETEFRGLGRYQTEFGNERRSEPWKMPRGR